MKLPCFYCEDDTEIIVTPSGNHLKATCSKCGRYMKFLNKAEKKLFEKEEDEKGAN